MKCSEHEAVGMVARQKHLEIHIVSCPLTELQNCTVSGVAFSAKAVDGPQTREDIRR